MTADRARLRIGMEVIGSDGQTVGHVAEVRDQDMLVRRDPQGDIYVPFDALDRISNESAALTIAAGDVDLENWPRAEWGSGGVSTDPGPAGSGMPFQGLGGPDFMGGGTNVPDAGAGNLTSSKDAGGRGAAPPRMPGGEYADTAEAGGPPRHDQRDRSGEGDEDTTSSP